MVFRRFLQAGKRALSSRRSETSRAAPNNDSSNGRRRRGRRSLDAETRGKGRLSMDENASRPNKLEAPLPKMKTGSVGEGDTNGTMTERRNIGKRSSSGMETSHGSRNASRLARKGSLRDSPGGSASASGSGLENGDIDVGARVTKRSTSRREGSVSPSGTSPVKARSSRGGEVKIRTTSAVTTSSTTSTAGTRMQAPIPKVARNTTGRTLVVEEPVVVNPKSSTSSGRAIDKLDDSNAKDDGLTIRKRLSPGKKSAIKGTRRLSLDEAAVRNRRDSNRRTSRGVSAELEGEHVRGLDVDPSRGLQKGMAVGEVSEAEKYRRLSLDGNLPEEARRPDAKPGKSELAGVIRLGAQGGFGGGVQFGACSKAGWEPHRTGRGGMTSVEVRKENQDAYFVYAPFGQESEVLLGVFDGHGSNGRTVAQFVRDTIPEAMRDEQDKLEELESQLHLAMRAGNSAKAPTTETNRMRVRALKAAFSRAERGLQHGEAAPCDHVFSGTTAVVAWIVNGTYIYCAWAGDSRCILGRKTTITTRSANFGADSMVRIKFKAVELSYDQKPMRADEKKRVRQAGGRVARWRRNIGPLRVWLPRDWVPGLAMTRSIGDTVLSDFGVSPIPEVSCAKLTPLDSFVVLASDGVWEFMNSDEVADFIGRWRKEEKDPSEAAEALVREAVRRWRRQEVVVDDTTAVVVWLDGESVRVGKSGYTPEGTPSHKARLEESISYTAKKKIWPFGRDKKDDKDKVLLVRDDGRFMPFHPRNDVLLG